MGFISIAHPDFSVRGVTRAYKAAVDEALADHQSVNMRNHFVRTAVSRYGGEYAKLSPSLRRNQRKQPLVLTGRLRSAVIQGHIQHVGPAKVRAMVFTAVPPYTVFTNPGGIDKSAAIGLTAASEERRIAQRIEAGVQKHLNRN